MADPHAEPGDLFEPGGAQPTLLRELNERIVLETIRDLRALSRAEIARRTGLSKPTVSLAIRTLESSGLVAQVGVDSGRPGRAGVLYAVIADAALALGLEIAVGQVRGVLVDLDGNVLAEDSTTVPDRTAEAIFDAAATCAGRLVALSGHDRDRITAAAVGTPGVIHPASGVLTQAGTLPELDGTSPAAQLTARLGVPTTVFNDVDLAALGEQADGAGRDVEDFVVLWAGSGLGAALVLGGELHRGHRGGAGEAHDIPFRAAIHTEHDAEPSVVVDVSNAGVVALAEAFAPAHPASALRRPYRPAALLDAASTGDPLAVAVRDRLSKWVAWYAAALAAIVDPELIVLAGPLLSHDSFVGTVGDELARLLDQPPRLTRSKLGDRAVLAGAISEARHDAQERAFANRIRSAREAS